MINRVANDIKNAFYFVRVGLSSLKKKHLKSLADIFRDLIEDGNSIHTQLYIMALGVISTKIYKPPPVKKKRMPPRFCIRLPFSSKALDFINLPQIIHNGSVKEFRPDIMNDDDVPMVVFLLVSLFALRY